jgi:hypothetical protein
MKSKTPPTKAPYDIRRKILGRRKPYHSTSGGLYNVLQATPLLVELSNMVLNQVLNTNIVNGAVFGYLDPTNPKKDQNDDHRFKCDLSMINDAPLIERLTAAVQRELHRCKYPNVLGKATIIRSSPGGEHQVANFQLKVSTNSQNLKRNDHFL